MRTLKLNTFENSESLKCLVDWCHTNISKELALKGENPEQIYQNVLDVFKEKGLRDLSLN